jgi:RNA polymerase sigma factor (TIGR02999 family)
MPGEVTRLLDGMEANHPQSAAELLPVVYEELRKLAAARMANESESHTLQPTALVHEAWLRLTANAAPTFQNRAHFFGAAAEAMRRILIDRARKRSRERHGGEWHHVDLDRLNIANPEDDDTLLAVSEALDRLAAHDPEGAELIKLRFFTGLTNVEAARLLGLSERTAKRTWAYARAWLYEELKQSR